MKIKRNERQKESLKRARKCVFQANRICKLLKLSRRVLGKDHPITNSISQEHFNAVREHQIAFEFSLPPIPRFRDFFISKTFKDTFKKCGEDEDLLLKKVAPQIRTNIDQCGIIQLGKLKLEPLK
jgi:hypothetical protein